MAGGAGSVFRADIVGGSRGRSGPGTGRVWGAIERRRERVSAGLEQRGCDAAEGAAGGQSAMGHRPRRGWGALGTQHEASHLGDGRFHGWASAEHTRAPPVSPSVGGLCVRHVRAPGFAVCPCVCVCVCPGSPCRPDLWAHGPCHRHVGSPSPSRGRACLSPPGPHVCPALHSLPRTRTRAIPTRVRLTTRPGPRVQTRVAGMCPRALTRVPGRASAHALIPEATPVLSTPEHVWPCSTFGPAPRGRTSPGRGRTLSPDVRSGDRDSPPPPRVRASAARSDGRPGEPVASLWEFATVGRWSTAAIQGMDLEARRPGPGVSCALVSAGSRWVLASL